MSIWVIFKNLEEFLKELPSKERFYSSLTGRKITDKGY